MHGQCDAKSAVIFPALVPPVPNYTVCAKYPTPLITGRICRRQLCRYFIYSRPILGFFAPQGRHVAPMKVKFGREERTEGPLLPAKFDLHRFRGGGLRLPKLKKIRIFPI